jgi:cytoskeletal protein RodZ
MDETETDDVVTVGQRLREAREAKGLSVEDIAAQTRIPTRHLLSLETGDWASLPAATYSIGFAKNYAGALGLDRTEIGDQLRAEMGGYSSATPQAEVYEAVDPARTMPKGLVISALALLLLVVLGLTWLSNRSTAPDEQIPEAANAAEPAANEMAPAPQPQAAAQGPVVLTATDAVWIQVKDGAATLHMGELAAGQRFEVPANAAAPVLTTGKPEALRISVGSTQAPPVGEPGKTVSDVSLKPADLLRTAQAGAPATSAPQQASPGAPRRPTPAPPPVQTPDPAVPSEGNSVVPAPGAAGQ